MGTELVKVCPVCRGTSFIKFLECKDYTHSHELFSIQQCKTCQVLLTNPRPDEENIGMFYPTANYISHSGKSTSIFDYIYLQARKIALRRKLNLIERHKKIGTILDYGCGTGEFLAFMLAHNWTTLGVEPAEYARTKAIKILGNNTDLVKGNIEELPVNAFDAITLWHVLEHVPRPDELLSSLKLKLNKDGFIFVAVPNHESHDAHYYREHWAGYDVPRHFWHFSPSQLQTILEGQGFKLHAKVPLKMDAYYVSLLSEKYKNNGKHNVLTPVKAFVRGLISNAKAKKTMNYSSLIYIARHG